MQRIVRCSVAIALDCAKGMCYLHARRCAAHRVQGDS